MLLSIWGSKKDIWSVVLCPCKMIADEILAASETVV